jgi:hypothetical protein
MEIILAGREHVGTLAGYTRHTATNGRRNTMEYVYTVAAILIYWIPSAVALYRKVPNRGSIIVVNLFFGWTVVGWIVALAMAVRDRKPL